MLAMLARPAGLTALSSSDRLADRRRCFRRSAPLHVLRSLRAGQGNAGDGKPVAKIHAVKASVQSVTVRGGAPALQLASPGGHLGIAAAYAAAVVVTWFASREAAASKAPADRWTAAALSPIALTLLSGLAVLAIPVPAGLTVQAWRLLAVFVATIAGLILQPMPMGVVALAGLSTAVVSGALPFQAAFAAYSDQVPWLILLSMFLAQAIGGSGLGKRLAFHLVSGLGRTTLGLAYAITAAEALLSPFIPAVAARAGGIMLPIVKALASSGDASAADAPASGASGKGSSLGTYLMLCLFQTSAVSSSMFLTANNPNLLTASITKELTGISLTWTQWALAACVPCLASLVAIPAFLYVFFPPAHAGSPAAQELAAEQLRAMGPMTPTQAAVVASVTLTVVLWVVGGPLGFDTVTAAVLGLTLLLATGGLKWADCLANAGAWDTFIWFGAVMALAGALRPAGLVGVASAAGGAVIAGLGLAWPAALAVIVTAYVYSHVLFASNVSHVSALFAAFLGVAVACGAPPFVAAFMLCLWSNPVSRMSTLM